LSDGAACERIALALDAATAEADAAAGIETSAAPLGRPA
jgi:hypothetical protein